MVVKWLVGLLLCEVGRDAGRGEGDPAAPTCGHIVPVPTAVRTWMPHHCYILNCASVCTPPTAASDREVCSGVALPTNLVGWLPCRFFPKAVVGLPETGDGTLIQSSVLGAFGCK